MVIKDNDQNEADLEVTNKFVNGYIYKKINFAKKVCFQGTLQ